MKNTLKVQRAILDLTQEDLAKKIGVSRQTINSIEKNRYVPSTVLALKLSAVFKISVNDFFKFEDKNIWGYEWFADLPKDRYSSSFTKVIYYVYSTNPDGSDKDQLYRLHVLMFHGANENFDYVLTKRLEKATEETSGTLYSYTYKEDIDFEKLKNDVKEVLKGNLQPDTKSTTRREKDGKVKVDVEIKK